MPYVSAIICTLDRSDDLRDALRALVAQTYPPEMFEIVVVDNGSKDDTPSVVAEFAANSGARVRYIVEPIQGLSQARNTGARAAAGEVIAYTDDDAIPQPNWLTALADAFQRYDDLGAAGGPIDPLWLPERPAWFPPQCTGLLGAMDEGPHFRWLTFPECPWGPNIALRKEAHERAGGFYTGLGLVGTHLALHEEPDLCHRIQSLGYRMAYTPRARVQHKMRADKVNKGYLRRWCWARGTGHVVLYLRTGYWLASDLALEGLHALKQALELWQKARITARSDPREALSAEWETYSRAGLAAESLRQLVPRSRIAAAMQTVPDTLASLGEEEAAEYPNTLLAELVEAYQKTIPPGHMPSIETSKYQQEINALSSGISLRVSLATARAELRKGHIIGATSVAMRAICSSLSQAAWRKATRLSRRTS